MATNFYAPNENAIEFLSGDEYMTITFSDTKMANKVRKLAKKFPDAITIHADGPKNGGYLYAKVPIEFLQIRPAARQPKKTEEQIEIARQRMADINARIQKVSETPT